MARLQDRERAIQLRIQGWSYREIKQELGLAKSTLSNWLSNYPLTPEQLELVQKRSQRNNDLAREKFRETMHTKREKRLRETYDIQKMILSLSDRELEIAGYFLYWGEGAKRINGFIGINNTDPKVVKFSLFWLTYVLRIPKEGIRVRLHLYRDMNIAKELEFWSNELKIPLSQFTKPYIKSSNKIGLTHEGFGHGTCGLVVSNVILKEHIIMSIAAISDYYCSKI